MKLRTDDEVIVISGKDKGKTGKIIRVDRSRDRVYVEGINIVKRHQRPNPGRPNAPVGVIEREVREPGPREVRLADGAVHVGIALPVLRLGAEILHVPVPDGDDPFLLALVVDDVNQQTIDRHRIRSKFQLFGIEAVFSVSRERTRVPHAAQRRGRREEAQALRRRRCRSRRRWR